MLLKGRFWFSRSKGGGCWESAFLADLIPCNPKYGPDQPQRHHEGAVSNLVGDSSESHSSEVMEVNTLQDGCLLALPSWRPSESRPKASKWVVGRITCRALSKPLPTLLNSSQWVVESGLGNFEEISKCFRKKGFMLRATGLHPVSMRGSREGWFWTNSEID